MSESDIEAGKAFVTLYVKIDESQNKSKAQQATRNIAATAKSAVAAQPQAQVSKVQQGINAAAAVVNKVAGGINKMTTELAGGLEKVAKEVDQVETAVKKLEPTLTQFASQIASIGASTVSIFRGLTSGGEIAAGFSRFAQAVGSATKAMARFAVVAAPVVAIIVAVAAALAGLYVAFKTISFGVRLVINGVKLMATAIKTVFTSAMKVVSAAVGYMVAAVKVGMAAMFRAISQPGKTFVQPLVNLFAAARDKIVGAISSIGESLEGIGRKIRNVGLGIGGMAAVLIGPLTAAAKEFAEVGQKAFEAARETDFSPSEFMALEYAAKRLGITFKDLKKLLKEGLAPKGLDSLVEEGKRLGMVLTDEQVHQASLFYQAMDRARFAAKGLAIQLGSVVAPALTEFTERATAFVRIAIDWVKKHGDIIATAFKIASIVGTVGAAIAGIGAIITAAGAGIGTLATVIGSIAAGFTALGGIVAAILTPWTLLVAALSAGGVALAAWLNPIELARQGLDKIGPALDKIKEKATTAIATAMRVFGEFKEWIGKVVGAINDAILGGSIEKAFAVAMTAAKVAFLRGLIEMADIAQGTLGSAFADLATGNLTKAFEQVGQSIKIVFTEAMGYVLPLWAKLEDAIDDAVTFMRKVWNTGVAELQALWNTGIEKMGTILRETLVSAFESAMDAMARGLVEIGKGLAKLALAAYIFNPTVAAVQAQQKIRDAIEGPDGLASLIGKGTGLEAPAANIANKEARDKAKSSNEELDKERAARQAERDKDSAARQAENQEKLDSLRRRRDLAAANGDFELAIKLDEMRRALERAIADAAAQRANYQPVDTSGIPIPELEKKKERERGTTFLSGPTASAAVAAAQGYGMVGTQSMTAAIYEQLAIDKKADSIRKKMHDELIKFNRTMERFIDEQRYE